MLTKAMRLQRITIAWQIYYLDIDQSMPQDAKTQDFIQKIGNPYCFKCRDTVVTVRFSDTEYTFEDGVIQYLKNKML